MGAFLRDAGRRDERSGGSFMNGFDESGGAVTGTRGAPASAIGVRGAADSSEGRRFLGGLPALFIHRRSVHRRLSLVAVVALSLVCFIGAGRCAMKQALPVTWGRARDAPENKERAALRKPHRAGRACRMRGAALYPVSCAADSRMRLGGSALARKNSAQPITRLLEGEAQPNGSAS